MEIHIESEKPNTPDAVDLLNELSDTLQAITGSSGRASFNVYDLIKPKSLFVVARDENGNAVGCGAIIPLSDEAAELKRVYAKEKGKGIGKKVVTFIEKSAKDLGYKYICLETRLVNERAVKF